MASTEWEMCAKQMPFCQQARYFRRPSRIALIPMRHQKNLFHRIAGRMECGWLLRYARELAKKVLDVAIRVDMAVDGNFQAAYGQGRLVFNLRACGHRFFDHGITVEVDDLLIHEFGHHYDGNHLVAEYHKALTRLGRTGASGVGRTRILCSVHRAEVPGSGASGRE